MFPYNLVDRSAISDKMCLRSSVLLRSVQGDIIQDCILWDLWDQVYVFFVFFLLALFVCSVLRLGAVFWRFSREQILLH